MKYLAILWIASLIFEINGKDIPGCLSTNDFVLISEGNPKTITNNFCFCNPNDSQHINIVCLFGSNSEHLQKSMVAVVNANETVETISIRNVNASEFVFPSNYFSQSAPNLIEFEMSNCRGNVGNLDNAFDGLSKLESIFIENCNIEKIPPSISNITGLKALSLSENKISKITAKEFGENSKTLEYLNVAGNFISEMEIGVLSNLVKLETLKIGQHNHASNSLMTEISNIKNLKALDLSAIDGLTNIAPTFFDNLKNIEELSFAGCSFKTINETTFQHLTSLKILDLRVNLIENISVDAFASLRNLTHLSLAGNYLKAINSALLENLNSLKVLDLSYNELTSISPFNFNGTKNSLKELNLAENRALKDIDDKSFDNLIMLQKLNISATGISSINKELLKTLPSLQEFDGSDCLITSIHEEAFAEQEFSLTKLNLNGNKLTKFSGGLVEKLEALTDLDLSENSWLCSEDIKSLKQAIDIKYKNAAKFKKDFFLKQSNNTVCNRPWKFNNISIMEIDEKELSKYVESQDITTIAPSTTTTTENPADTTKGFNLEDVTFMAGSSSDELTRNITTLEADENRPLYDINAVKKDNSEKESFSSWLGIGIVIFAVITIIILIVFVVKKVKNDIKTKKIHPSVEFNKDGRISMSNKSLNIASLQKEDSKIDMRDDL
uniref:LRRCT domain-containing protein n=1 Tax=Rhabditophanes sp. KR3021 TaxID=114890 RepID=A0AC35TGT8_9BILA